METVIEGKTRARKVAQVEKQLPAVQPANTPMAMLAAAVAQGADTEKLGQLMALQERWEKNEARKAFADAMVRFKAVPINIERNKAVSFGNTAYSHATLDNVCRQIIAGLQSVGIAHSWKPETKDGKVTVSCILRHQLGHEEAVTLDGPPDTSGSKNAIQALASTITYLERYSLLAATGLAVGVPDDDGRGAEAKGLSDSQVADFSAAIDASVDAEGLAVLWKTIAKACNEAKDRMAYDSLKNEVSHKGKALKGAA